MTLAPSDIASSLAKQDSIIFNAIDFHQCKNDSLVFQQYFLCTTATLYSTRNRPVVVHDY